MNKRRKTWLTGFLMAFGLIPVMAVDFTENGIYYNRLSGNNVEVTHGDQQYADYVLLPQTVVHNGTTYQVTAIGDEAFNSNTRLVSVSIPESVTKIGISAFSGCSRMQYITLPNSLTNIGSAAFYGCRQLKKISIPAATTTIGNEAFAGCESLSDFQVLDGNPNYAAVDGVLFNKQKTVLVAYTNGKSKSYVIPDGVTTVGEQAFVHCGNLEEVSLPTSLITIGDAAFYDCAALKKVNFSEGLKTIGMMAFSECLALEQVNLPKSVTSIGEGAFSFCSNLENIYVTSGSGAYKSDNGVLLSADGSRILAVPGKKDGSFSIPTSVTIISPQAFFGCDQLTTVNIPASLADLGDNPFLFCASLKEMQVDGNNAKFSAPDGVLYNKEKTNLLYFPNAKDGSYKVLDGVTELSNGPFFGSNSLAALSIPSTVRSISDWTFLCCEGLKSVFLPYQLNVIGRTAFKGCSSLQEIICAGSPYSIDDFDSEVYGQAKLYVPYGLTNAYQTTPGWGGFTDVKEYGLSMHDGVATRAQSQVVSVDIADGLPVSSFQLEVNLPKGFILTEGEDGKAAWLSDTSKNTHTLDYTKKDNENYLVTVRSSEDKPLVVDEEGVLHLNLQVTPEASTGTSMIGLKDVNFTFSSPLVALNEGEQNALQQDIVANLNVLAFKGDVNVNGRLNVADFVEDALYLNGTQTESFHFDEADVSNNGKVTIEDVNRTLNLIQDEQALVVKEFVWDTEDKPANKLSVSDSWVQSGGEGRMRFKAPEDLTSVPACQFDVVLPKSVSVKGVENEGSYVSVIDTDDEGNSIYRVIVAPLDVHSLLSTAGELPSVILQSEEETELGTVLPVKLERVVLAGANAKEYLLDDITFDLLVGDGSGINNVSSEDGLFSHPQDILNINGQLVRKAAVSLDGLPAGVYIVGEKKITVGRF